MTRAVPLVLAAAALLPAGAALAQQEPNPLLTFSFSSSLNVSDNYDLSVEKPGTTTFVDNYLGLSYASETAAQLLRVGASGIYRLSDVPEAGFDSTFDDQTLRFDYTRFGAASELTLRGRYNRAELAFFDPLSLIDDISDLDPSDLLNNPDGARETMSAGISYNTDPDAPLSFSLSADTYRRNYTGVSDPEYYDSETNSLSGSLGLLVAPTTRVFVNGAVRERRTEDDEDMKRLDQSASLGLQHEMARGLTLNGSLGYQVVDTDRTNTVTGLRYTETEDGLTAAFGATQDLTNGSIGTQLSHAITATGGRNNIQVFRSLDLPDGTLYLMGGVSKGDEGKASFIGNVTYDHTLENGSVFLGLSRDVHTDDDDEDTTQMRARAGWTHNLTPVSYARLTVDFTNIDAIEGATSRQRGRVRASYNHELTADWAVSGGYEYSFNNREDSPDADENLVFLTIGRDFDFRP